MTAQVPRLHLLKHVFVCLADNYYVFLDLKQDRYLCVERARLDEISPLFAAQDEPANAPTAADQSSSTVHPLVAANLLTENENEGKRFALTVASSPMESLASADSRNSLLAMIRRLPAFVLASRRAHVALRRLPLEQTVGALAHRKAKRRIQVASFDAQLASHLVSVFNSLRPFFPRNYLCLFDSLALLEFLALYELYPSWVFGVRANPFGAHCWVQEGSLLLNDTMDSATTYVPVMTI